MRCRIFNSVPSWVLWASLLLCGLLFKSGSAYGDPTFIDNTRQLQVSSTYPPSSSFVVSTIGEQVAAANFLMYQQSDNTWAGLYRQFTSGYATYTLQSFLVTPTVNGSGAVVWRMDCTIVIKNATSFAPIASGSWTYYFGSSGAAFLDANLETRGTVTVLGATFTPAFTTWLTFSSTNGLGAATAPASTAPTSTTTAESLFHDLLATTYPGSALLSTYQADIASITTPTDAQVVVFLSDPLEIASDVEGSTIGPATLPAEAGTTHVWGIGGMVWQLANGIMSIVGWLKVTIANAGIKTAANWAYCLVTLMWVYYRITGSLKGT